jgi:hypothetical protein
MADRIKHIQDTSNTTPEFDDDWTLTTDQMIFVLQHNNVIETAYNENNMELLGELESSAEYKTVFGEMSWDEAFDRYEDMLDAGKNVNT